MKWKGTTQEENLGEITIMMSIITSQDTIHINADMTTTTAVGEASAEADEEAATDIMMEIIFTTDAGKSYIFKNSKYYSYIF